MGPCRGGVQGSGASRVGGVPGQESGVKGGGPV